MSEVLYFVNLDAVLREPVSILQSHLNYQIAEVASEGIEVTVEKNQEGLQAVLKNGKASLSYHNKVEFFRGFGLLLEAIRENRELDVREKPSFRYLTYMQDNSRNAVSNMEALKKLIRQLALMGFNSLMLYTEDTYELEGYPYFGYQRGRFTKEELKVIDAYGSMFGVELVPCMQTLAHLNAIFQWETFADINDTKDILLCGHEKTYELIEAMIKTWSEVFASRRINIGMDEAEMLGCGKFLKTYGFQETSDIMAEHLTKVLAICKKYGMHAMMWSDMFFKMLPDNTEYYNTTAEIPREIKDKIPEDVELVYWDYYSRDKQIYDNMILRHKQLSDRIGFAGGAWKWYGFAPLLHHSMMVSELAVRSCLEQGINNVIVTGWGDNGAETSNFVVGPVLQLYAEACYGSSMEREHISHRLATCCHMDYEDYMLLDLVNLTPDNPSPGSVSVGPAKYLFYQDVLQGLYDKHIDLLTYPVHYRKCHEILSKAAEKKNEFSYIFDTLAKLSYVLELKCDLGIRLKKAYDNKDLSALKEIAQIECPELIGRIEDFHEAFRYQWYQENKPFGFDVQDIRIGGLKERIRAVSWRVGEYLNHNIETIEELEQERLTQTGRDNNSDHAAPIWHNDWRRAVTASVI